MWVTRKEEEEEEEEEEEGRPRAVGPLVETAMDLLGVGFWMYHGIPGVLAGCSMVFLGFWFDFQSTSLGFGSMFNGFP